MPGAAHVAAIAVGEFGKRLHVEPHHFLLAAPIGIEISGPIREAGVVDQIFDGDSMRRGEVMQPLRCVRFAQIGGEYHDPHLVLLFQCGLYGVEAFLVPRRDHYVVAVCREQ